MRREMKWLHNETMARGVHARKRELWVCLLIRAVCWQCLSQAPAAQPLLPSIPGHGSVPDGSIGSLSRRRHP